MKDIKKILFKLLKKEYPLLYLDLSAEINEEFEILKKDIGFAYHSKNPMDKRMPVSAYLLAAIKTLDRNGIEYDSIRKIILELANELTIPKNVVQRFFKALIPLFLKSWVARFILKRFNDRLKKYPQKDGFSIDVLTTKKDTLGFGYGVNILECGICKLFSKHKYERFVPILCEVDYLTSSLSGLQLIREGTIANGNQVCDFRYKKL